MHSDVTTLSTETLRIEIDALTRKRNEQLDQRSRLDKNARILEKQIRLYERQLLALLIAPPQPHESPKKK